MKRRYLGCKVLVMILFYLQMRLSALKQILALLHNGEGTVPVVLQDACGSTLNLHSLLLSAQLQLLLGTLGPEVMRPSSQPGDIEGFLLLHYQVLHIIIMVMDSHVTTETRLYCKNPFALY